MSSNWIALASDDPLETTERPFRVFAGPGAGKTHWLVGHIRHVAAVSPRLIGGARIACISYTNVAVEEIRSRLGDAASLAEVSTIHSFLYRFVVRPYLHLVRDGAGVSLVRHDLVDGHDEHRPRRGTVMRWLQSFGVNQVPYGAMQYLRTVHWRKDTGGGWQLTANRSDVMRAEVVRKLQANLPSYKRFYWEEGSIDHDDVLYFADRILSERPELQDFIAARFPYVFVDEFQDTNPVQTAVVRWLSEAGSTVGVIGDREQSIYGFQGATPQDFEGFSLPGLDDYIIEGNRRSTRSILRFLNTARRDGMAQKPVRDEDGEPVIVLVGDAAMSYRAASEWLQGERLVALAFRHDHVNQLRDPEALENDRVWEAFYDADPVRAEFLERVIRATEMGGRRMFGPAVKEILAAFRLRDRRVRDPLRLTSPLTDSDRRGIAASVLEWAVEVSPAQTAAPLREYYDRLSEALNRIYPGLGLAKVVGGKFGDFAAAHTHGQLARNVRLPEETRDARTIHQAKGAEFDNVLLRLQSELQLLRLCGLTSADSEGLQAEGRTYYVGASRARNRLVLSVPSLSKGSRKRLEEMSIKVVLILDNEGAVFQ
jgi:DNA helicase-2/ATP-dependent DNA helicase PcrA